MTFQTGVTEFAEFVGSEIKRIEKKIQTDGGGGSQSSDSQIITGNGRPDKPDTTGDVLNGVENKIKGNEPNGTIYRSINGAGVGAYLWQKQNNKWIVISGDTGPRRMGNSSVNIKEGAIYLRRMNNRVECSFNTGRWTLSLFMEVVIPNSQGKITPSEWIFYHLQEYQSASVPKPPLCFLFIAMTVMRLQ